MAKPDRGVLQQRFLSEHAATGVSSKEWRESQGPYYATERRYIKKSIGAIQPAEQAIPKLICGWA